MFRSVFLSAFLLWNTLSFSQVGIGTINPSDAAMLEVSSSSDNMNFFGFLPPRVAANTERDLINTTIDDVGMLVYVYDTGSLCIWNGTAWEVLHTLSTFPTILVQQDFDLALSWTYTSSPAFYAVGNDIFDVTTDLGTGDTSAIDNVRDNFVAYRDLDNTNGGGNFDHQLIFDNVNVSSLPNPRIAFDWDVFEFDNGDDLTYEVFHDDISQGVVTLFSGTSTGSGISGQGTEVISIPLSVTLVRITVSVNQNGNADFAAVDNFVIYSN